MDFEQQRIWRSARPKARLIEGRADWFRIENKAAGGPVDVYIYDEIGYFGVTASDFVRELQAIKAGEINLHLNTPGGDVFDGIAIYNALKAHAATVNVTIDALAASIGSVIAMAGDHVTIVPSARMMIHEAYALAIGNAADMKKMAARLDETSNIIAGIYAERSGLPQADWRQKMTDETWYTGQQAVDAGLCDECIGAPGKQAASFDLSIFRHANGAENDEEEEIEPEIKPAAPVETPIEDEVELALRALPEMAAQSAAMRELEAALGYRPLIAERA